MANRGLFLYGCSVYTKKVRLGFYAEENSRNTDYYIYFLAVKLARTSLVCVFTLFFALIAMLGEGLHFLPGLGHYDHALCDGCMPSHSSSSHDCTNAEHSESGSNSILNSHGSHNAADCPVCQYFAQAKPLVVTLNTVADSLVVVERLEIDATVLQSRSQLAYHSRAPPSSLAIS
jgi:hypothetical protein